MSDAKTFIPVLGQSFISFEDWVNTATRRLTYHPDYHDTEHGKKAGWRGEHFTALCFDQKGRRVRMGAGFMRARDEGAFPVWWIWPDQIAPLLMGGNDHE